MVAARRGKTKTVVEVTKAGADWNLQNSVSLYLSYFLLYLSLHALFIQFNINKVLVAT